MQILPCVWHGDNYLNSDHYAVLVTGRLQKVGRGRYLGKECSESIIICICYTAAYRAQPISSILGIIVYIYLQVNHFKLGPDPTKPGQTRPDKTRQKEKRMDSIAGQMEI